MFVARFPYRVVQPAVLQCIRQANAEKRLSPETKRKIVEACRERLLVAPVEETKPLGIRTLGELGADQKSALFDGGEPEGPFDAAFAQGDRLDPLGMVAG